MGENESILGFDKDFLKIDIEDYDLSNAKEQKKKKRVKGNFIAGPIPLDWIQKACSLGANAAKLSWLLWFYHGMSYGDYFKVSNIRAAPFSLNRHQKNQALSRLETAGLVTVQREDGNAPIVQLLVEEYLIK